MSRRLDDGSSYDGGLKGVSLARVTEEKVSEEVESSRVSSVPTVSTAVADFKGDLAEEFNSNNDAEGVTTSNGFKINGAVTTVVDGNSSIMARVGARTGAPAECSAEKKVAWGSWRWSFREAVQLPLPFWRALLVFTVLKVARFSEAFVTLHANAVGLKAAYLPMLMVATNIMQSLLTYPLGVIADRVDDRKGVYGNGRKFMLLGGFGMMVVADLVLVMAKSPWQVFLGYLAVGVHMSMTQANMKAALSATLPPNVRGTGFAISALTQGIALGAGNYMAGRLCDIFGSSGAFWGGGAFATAALGLGWLLL